MKKLLAALAFMASTALGASSFTDVEKSVFLLYGKSMNGDMNFKCTATSIGEHKFLTAAHCVTQLDPKGEKLVPSQDTFYLSNDDPDSSAFMQAKISFVGAWDEGDFAVLTSKLDAPAVKLGDDRKCERGDDVFNVSGAAGLGRQFFKGYISVVTLERNIIIPEQHINWTGYMSIVLYASGGASGSAVFNRQGELIGVLVGTVDGVTAVAPISRLQAILKKPASLLVTPSAGASPNIKP